MTCLSRWEPGVVSVGSGFGVWKSFMERHVWACVERHLTNTRMREFYGGFVYIRSGIEASSDLSMTRFWESLMRFGPTWTTPF